MTASCAQAALVMSLLVTLPSLPAWGQGLGCTLTPVVSSPSRHVLRCPETVPVEVEAGASTGPEDRDGNGRADALQVRRGALYMETPGGTPRGHLQILTPHAIASVRGTRWAVEVSGARTSVFVAAGRVHVRRRASSRAVTLGAGEGVDVERGSGPLRVARWSPSRAAALLARFGR